MAAASGSDGRKVIIDAGAAIKLQRLDRLGSELYTTSGVLAEVRDENARALLGTLPQELQIKEPLPQDRTFVQHFAKATGDFGFLSQNDMDLIALTLRLHREAGGTVRDKPAALSHEEGGTATFDWAPARADKAAGASASDAGSRAGGAAAADGDGAAARSGGQPFAPAPRVEAAAATGAEADAEGEVKAAAAEEDGGEEWVSVSRGSKGRRGAARAARPSGTVPPQPRHLEGGAAASSGSTAVPEEAAVRDLSGTAAASAADVAAAVAAAEAAAEEEVEVGEEAACAAEGHGEQDQDDEDDDEEALDSDEDGSSAGEWVTPENMHRFGVNVELDSEVRVTCATSDYSVQNVLLQMGITPLTFDGYAVRSVKLWGLVCRACFFFTRESQKIFCPKCGHDTLVRVPIIVDADGRPVALNNGRKLRTKGTVFSMPKPQWGRGWKPILAEDELRLGGRDREMRRLENLHNKEKSARDPFNEDNAARAWHQRGTTATGKQLSSNAPRVHAGFGRRNPNANNFGGFKKKR